MSTTYASIFSQREKNRTGGLPTHFPHVRCDALCQGCYSIVRAALDVWRCAQELSEPPLEYRYLNLDNPGINPGRERARFVLSIMGKARLGLVVAV